MAEPWRTLKSLPMPIRRVYSVASAMHNRLEPCHCARSRLRCTRIRKKAVLCLYMFGVMVQSVGAQPLPILAPLALPLANYINSALAYVRICPGLIALPGFESGPLPEMYRLLYQMQTTGTPSN